MSYLNLPRHGEARWSTYSAIVTAVAGVVTAPTGELIGPSSGITYTVAINTPSGIQEFAGVIPSVLRWPDIVDTVASPPNTLCTAHLIGEVWLFDIAEHPYITPCPPPEALAQSFGGAFRG